MPSDLPDITEEYTHEFQFQYQKFRLWTQIKRYNRDQIVLSWKLEQTRADDVLAVELFVDDNHSPFLPISQKTNQLIYIDTGTATVRNEMAHQIRPTLREHFVYRVRDAWLYREAPENRESARRSFRKLFDRGYVTINDVYNRVNQFFMDSINDFVEKFPCGGGCNVFHINPEEHVILWNEQLIPQRMASVEEVMVDGEPLEIWFTGTHGARFRDWLQREGITFCEGCQEHTRDASYLDDIVYCTDCWEANVQYCENCDQATGDLREAYDYSMGDTWHLCPSCYAGQQREETGSLDLQNYTYKPPPNFYYIGHDDHVRKMFMGMELEVAREDRTGAPAINQWMRDQDEDFLYFKGDSSVTHGFEIVTHPFTYKWALDKFPFDAFKELLKIPAILAEHQSAGTHVHISKAAFTSPHLWKFIKFHLDCADFAGLVGGRGADNDYGSLKRDSATMKAKLMDTAKQKGANGRLLGIGRSVGINLQPADTVELRYLAGNINPDAIRKNIEWVQGVFEFTEMVSVRDAARGALRDAGYFLGFLEDNNYLELKTFIERTFPTPKKLGE